MKRIGKNILPLLILFSVMLAGGQTVFAAATSVQVTAQLTENTVEVTGTLQGSESVGASEIGVLIASKDADFNQLSSEDIVYANQYDLDENGTFSFKAELPNADLKEYVLQIGDETGLLYRKLLDGSAIPELPSDPDGDGDNTQNPESPNPEDPDNDSQGSGSNQGGDSQKPDTSNPDNSGNDSQGSGSNKGNNSNKNTMGTKTGDSQNTDLWISLTIGSILVFAAAILKRKRGGSHHA